MECLRTGKRGKIPSVLQKSGGCHRTQSCFWSAYPSNRWFPSEQPDRPDENSAQISRPSAEWKQLRPALRGTIAARPPQGTGRPVILAFAEALSWLTTQGLIVIDPEQPALWYRLTRRASGLRTRTDVEAQGSYPARRSCARSLCSKGRATISSR